MHPPDWEPQRLTQTTFGTEGNCWQTCCAMLLGVELDALPAQGDYDKFRLKENGAREWYGPGYNNVLQAYLIKHHGLCYQEMHQAATLYEHIAVSAPGWHMMTGRTVRSDQFHGTRHVVVARFGEVWHDPHPSRAGLLEELRWAFLVKHPTDWRRQWEKERCKCPACGPDGLPVLD